MKRLSARPHHLGSPYGKENADFIASQFRSWGYDTKLEEFQVLFPTPKTRLVEMTAPTKFKLALQETEMKEDATSGQTREQAGQLVLQLSWFWAWMRFCSSTP